MPAFPRSLVATTMLAALLGALLLPVGTGEQDPVTVVAAGTTMELGALQHVQALEVFGTLRAAQPGDVTIRAISVHVGRGGAIVALPGAAGADAEGSQAVGGDGAPGAGVTIITGRLVVDEGGWIPAGPGGPGGSATSTRQATGGHGGRGGGLVVEAASVAIDGHAIPGSGGHGGNAVSEAKDAPGLVPTAVGGNAGAAGQAG